MINADQLQDYPLFAGLSETELSSLAPSLSRRTFAKGAYLFYPGSQSQNIYLVESGLIRVFFTNSAGQEFLIDLAGPRAIVGLLLLREDQTHVGGAAALRPSTVLILSQKDLNYFIQSSPRFMHNIYQAMDNEIRKLLLYALALDTPPCRGIFLSRLGKRP